MLSILFMLLACIFLSYLLSEFAKKLAIPSVVGYILAGIILGLSPIKSFIFNHSGLDVLYALATLGMIFLFYYTGIKTSIGSIKKNIKESFLISIFNTSIPLLLGFLTMTLLFGFNAQVGIIVGLCLSMGSQSISIDVLEELKLIKTKIGSLLITTGALDDIVELILATIFLTYIDSAASNTQLFNLIFQIALFALIVYLFKIVIIPYILERAENKKSKVSRFTSAIIIMLLMAVLAENFAIGAVVGVLIAGVLVGNTMRTDKNIPISEKEDIANSMHTIAFGLFIPLFFIWVGLNIQLNAITGNLPLALILTLIATIGTVGGTIIALLINKESIKQGWLLGWGLNAKGDIELVIASIALSIGVINSTVFSAITITALITTVISPIMFKHALKSSKYKSKIFSSSKKKQ